LLTTCIDGGFSESCGDVVSIPIALSVIRDERGIVADIGLELFQLLGQILKIQVLIESETG
jgi:hypothetical protein